MNAVNMLNWAPRVGLCVRSLLGRKVRARSTWGSVHRAGRMRDDRAMQNGKPLLFLGWMNWSENLEKDCRETW